MSVTKKAKTPSKKPAGHTKDMESLLPIWEDSSILPPDYDNEAITEILSDGDEKNHLSEKELKTFVALLSYVRKAPGTVNKYELTNRVPNFEEINYIDKINKAFGIGLLEEIANGTKNTNLDTVVTAYRYRHIIDLFLDMFTIGDNYFNPLLFSDSVRDYQPPKQQDKNITIKFVIASSFMVETNDKEIIVYTEPEQGGNTQCQKMIINKSSISPEMALIYEKIAERLTNREKTYKIPDSNSSQNVQDFKECFFNEDNVNLLLETSDYGNLDLSDCYFAKQLTFRKKHFNACVDFSRSYFAEGVVFENCTFDHSFVRNTDHESVFSSSDSLLCFREARINSNMRFNACRFNSLEKIKNSRITFEDAVFPSGNSNAELTMRGNSFSGVKLDFFETNLASIRIELSNSSLNDSSINFDGSRMRNRIVFSNLDLCECHMDFAIGNRVLLANCNISKDFYISNVAQFEMTNTEVDGGKIHSRSSWDFSANKSRVNPPYEHPYLAEKYFPKNTHPLLLSCVGTLEDVSKQFLILHNCFDDQGDFNSSDDAYLLYLRTKTDNMKTDTVQSLFKKCIYKSLDFIGNFGISAIRLAKATAILIGVSFILYLFFTVVLQADATVGQCMYWAFVNTINIQDMSEYPGIFGVIATIHTFVGWFFLGYFSMAIIRKTIRE